MVGRGPRLDSSSRGVCLSGRYADQPWQVKDPLTVRPGGPVVAKSEVALVSDAEPVLPSRVKRARELGVVRVWMLEHGEKLCGGAHGNLTGKLLQI